MPKTITTNLVDVEKEDIQEIHFMRSTVQSEDTGVPVEVEVWTLRVRYQVRDDLGNVHHQGNSDSQELAPGLHGRLMPIVNVDILPLVNSEEGM